MEAQQLKRKPRKATKTSEREETESDNNSSPRSEVSPSEKIGDRFDFQSQSTTALSSQKETKTSIQRDKISSEPPLLHSRTFERLPVIPELIESESVVPEVSEYGIPQALSEESDKHNVLKKDLTSELQSEALKLLDSVVEASEEKYRKKHTEQKSAQVDVSEESENHNVPEEVITSGTKESNNADASIYLTQKDDSSFADETQNRSVEVTSSRKYSYQELLETLHAYEREALIRAQKEKENVMSEARVKEKAKDVGTQTTKVFEVRPMVRPSVRTECAPVTVQPTGSCFIPEPSGPKVNYAIPDRRMLAPSAPPAPQILPIISDQPTMLSVPAPKIGPVIPDQQTVLAPLVQQIRNPVYLDKPVIVPQATSSFPQEKPNIISKQTPKLEIAAIEDQSKIVSQQITKATVCFIREKPHIFSTQQETRQFEIPAIEKQSTIDSQQKIPQATISFTQEKPNKFSTKQQTPQLETPNIENRPKIVSQHQTPEEKISCIQDQSSVISQKIPKARINLLEDQPKVSPEQQTAEPRFTERATEAPELGIRSCRAMLPKSAKLPVHVIMICDGISQVNETMVEMRYWAHKTNDQLKWLQRALPKIMDQVLNNLASNAPSDRPRDVPWDLKSRMNRIYAISENLQKQFTYLEVYINILPPDTTKKILQSVHARMYDIYAETADVFKDCKYVLSRYNSALSHSCDDNILRVNIKVDVGYIYRKFEKSIVEFLLANYGFEYSSMKYMEKETGEFHLFGDQKPVRTVAERVDVPILRMFLTLVKHTFREIWYRITSIFW